MEGKKEHAKFRSCVYSFFKKHRRMFAVLLILGLIGFLLGLPKLLEDKDFEKDLKGYLSPLGEMRTSYLSMLGSFVASFIAVLSALLLQGSGVSREKAKEKLEEIEKRKKARLTLEQYMAELKHYWEKYKDPSYDGAPRNFSIDDWYMHRQRVSQELYPLDNGKSFRALEKIFRHVEEYNQRRDKQYLLDHISLEEIDDCLLALRDISGKLIEKRDNI